MSTVYVVARKSSAINNGLDYRAIGRLSFSLQIDTLCVVSESGEFD